MKPTSNPTAKVQRRRVEAQRPESWCKCEYARLLPMGSWEKPGIDLNAYVCSLFQKFPGRLIVRRLRFVFGSKAKLPDVGVMLNWFRKSPRDFSEERYSINTK